MKRYVYARNIIPITIRAKSGGAVVQVYGVKFQQQTEMAARANLLG